MLSNHTLIVHPLDSKNQADALAAILAAKGYESTPFVFPASVPGHIFYQQILDSQPFLVFTFDLAGFSLRTDTGYPAFINLPFPSAHFLNDQLSAEELSALGGTLSLAMSFYCFSEEKHEYLQATYPNIPYLKCVADIEAAVADALEEVTGASI